MQKARGLRAFCIFTNKSYSYTRFRRCWSYFLTNNLALDSHTAPLPAKATSITERKVAININPF